MHSITYTQTHHRKQNRISQIDRNAEKHDCFYVKTIRQKKNKIHGQRISKPNNTCGKQMENVNFGNQQLYGAKCISMDK